MFFERTRSVAEDAGDRVKVFKKNFWCFWKGKGWPPRRLRWKPSNYELSTHN